MTSIDGRQTWDETPLFGAEGCNARGRDYLEFDEDGSLALARAAADDAAATGSLPVNHCSLADLNGSWFLQLRRHSPASLPEIRGPMRIEVAAPRLRVSGDMYVTTPVLTPGDQFQPIAAGALPFGRNWYPQLPQGDYRWYFRSTGVVYNAGRLTFGFVRHLWDPIRSDFVGQDSGQATFQCDRELLNHPLLPQATLQMPGTIRIGGELFDAVASKTSPFYRGCAIEVDLMRNRTFPVSATAANGAALTFESIYRTAGWECTVALDQINLPEDAKLSIPELQAALAGNRKPATSPDAWRLWLMVGSLEQPTPPSTGTTFGVMFDQTAPHREGAVGFFDSPLGNAPNIAAAARGKKIGEVAAAFLRTMVHEAGHAFNLAHPKADIHNVPVGTTIMNQTGDVLSFATTVNPFPGIISHTFDDHNRTALIHAPDPQTAPGWMRFGSGHSSGTTGLPAPIDALGLPRAPDAASGLRLELVVPETIFRGEFVSAAFLLSNQGEQPLAVSAALNLAQGDLHLLLTPPNGDRHNVRDSIVACGDRPMMVLEPGQTATGNGQIFFTNQGFTFRQTGRYYLSAELDIGDGSGEVVRSEPATIVVRAPLTEAEEATARVSMKPAVGAAFALGDYGADEGTLTDLEALADADPGADTGIAAALVLANSTARDLRDLRSGECLRKADAEASRRHFQRAADAAAAQGARALVRLATAVAAPVEARAPVLDMVADYLRGGGKRRQAGPAAAALTAEAGDSAAEANDGAADLLEAIRGTLAGL